MRTNPSASVLRTPWQPWLVLASVLNSLAIACIELATACLVRHCQSSLTRSMKRTRPSFAPRSTSEANGEPSSDSMGITGDEL